MFFVFHVCLSKVSVFSCNHQTLPTVVTVTDYLCFPLFFSFYFPFSFLFISPLPSTILPSFFLLLFHPFSPSFLFSFSSILPSSFPSSSAAVMFLTPSRTFSHLVSALAAYLTI